MKKIILTLQELKVARELIKAEIRHITPYSKGYPPLQEYLSLLRGIKNKLK